MPLTLVTWTSFVVAFVVALVALRMLCELCGDHTGSYVLLH